MTLAQAWERAFQSFLLFIGTGLIWLGLIEPRLPSRQLSVTAMTAVAVVLAAGWFYLGFRQARRQKLAVQAKTEEAAAQYEDEVG